MGIKVEEVVKEAGGDEKDVTNLPTAVEKGKAAPLEPMGYRWTDGDEEDSTGLPSAMEESSVTKVVDSSEAPNVDPPPVGWMRKYIKYRLWTDFLEVLRTHVLFNIWLMDRTDTSYTRFERICNFLAFIGTELINTSGITASQEIQHAVCSCIKGIHKSSECHETSDMLFSLPAEPNEDSHYYIREWKPYVKYWDEPGDLEVYLNQYLADAEPEECSETKICCIAYVSYVIGDETNEQTDDWPVMNHLDTRPIGSLQCFSIVSWVSLCLTCFCFPW